MAMDLNSNMELVGKRHPYLANYKIGVDQNGKALALQMDLYCDGGLFFFFGGGVEECPNSIQVRNLINQTALSRRPFMPLTTVIIFPMSQ